MQITKKYLIKKISFNHIFKIIKLFFIISIKTWNEIIFNILYPLVWLLIMYFSYESIPGFFNLYFGTWTLGSSMILGLLTFGKALGLNYFNNCFFIQKNFGYKKSEYFIGTLIYYFLYLTIVYYLQIFFVYIAFGTTLSTGFILINWLNNFSVVFLFSFYSLGFVKFFRNYKNYNLFLNISYSSFILFSGYSIPYFLFNGSADINTKGWYNFFQSFIPLGSNIQLSAYAQDINLGNYMLAIENGWYLPFGFLIFYLIFFICLFFINNFFKIKN